MSCTKSMLSLCCLWIICANFQNRGFSGDTFAQLALRRGYLAQAVWIVLEGFNTHYLYKTKSFKTYKHFLQFYARSMCRVLLTYYAATFIGLIDPLYTTHDALASDYPTHTLASTFLIQSWFHLPANTQFSTNLPREPVPGGWLISTLSFCW